MPVQVWNLGGSEIESSSLAPDRFRGNQPHLRMVDTRHLQSATDQSVALRSSHIRKQFHRVGISDNDGHGRQCVAR